MSLATSSKSGGRGVVVFLVAWASVLSGIWASSVDGRLEAAEFDAAKLANLGARLQPFVDQGEVSGLVAMVGTRDGVARIESLGMRDLERRTPMSGDTLFKIASMTKPLTALGVMMLVEQGRLSVDDPVEKHLPEFQGQMLAAARDANGVTLRKPSRPITVRDLLTHTSGLPGGFPAGLADLYSKRDRTLAEAVLVSSQRPLDFEPGSRWSYCNAGIDTLGRIIEVLSGESYDSFLRRTLFEPLGMVDTGCFPGSRQLERAAQVYEIVDGRLQPAKKLIVGTPVGAKHPVPAGGLYSTAVDLAKIYQMMLRRGEAGGRRIVAESTVATMTSLQTGELTCGFVPGMGFGYGWAVVKQPQGVTEMLSTGTFGHGGAFGTQAWIDPRKGVFLVLLIQRTGLKNADGSELRRVFQQAAIEALK